MSIVDVGAYPFKQAKHYTAGRIKPIRLVVIHDGETPEMGTSAEGMQAYFAGPNAPQASAHLAADDNSVVRCVHDADTAWAAPGANADGLHIEHAGRASQTQSQWLDPYGKAMLELSAKAVAGWCKAHAIPVVRLTPSEIANGTSKGICGHLDVTNAFHTAGGHTDPGVDFPWTYYLGRVKAFLNGPSRPLLKFGSHGPDVLRFTVALNRHGYPTSDRDVYGNPTVVQVRKLQTAHKIPVTGTATIPTWEALGM